MFSKSKPEPKPEDAPAGLPEAHGFMEAAPAPQAFERPALTVPQPPKAKPAASVLSSDLTITGNVRSSGDIQVEGTVEGDIRASTLIVGESATVKGEVIAEEVVVHGRVVGRLRGLKVRLTASARCEGDIVHKTIAIESGAQFEGSVQRQDDPLGKGNDGQVRSASPMALATA